MVSALRFHYYVEYPLNGMGGVPVPLIMMMMTGWKGKASKRIVFLLWEVNLFMRWSSKESHSCSNRTVDTYVCYKRP